ncbi:hypothetical protein C5612_10405 [Pseudomonas frederiksbergensis]|uniref:Uncharacterized protein n=1 Tax=Pseudomonas frederiksbergensis TaxID=104087 RepID=A0A2S8HPC4_9PSED|nr:hypothetical protein C5612_10405 [Pseudomonas frederiksbergensis]
MPHLLYIQTVHKRHPPVDPLDIEDTSDWLGYPTELETIKHYSRMLENEVQELTLQLRKAREDIFGLVQMNSQLSSEKANLSRELKKTLEDVGRLNTETSERDRTIYSLRMIEAQRDNLLRERNERYRQSLNEKHP